MSSQYSADPDIARAIATLVSICERHTAQGRAVIDPDCGDCGTRQEATATYFLGVVNDAAKALGLTCRTPCDADCEVGCHETHQPTWKRDHQPEDCPGEGR